MELVPDAFVRLVVCFLLASNVHVTLAKEYYWTVKVKAGKVDCYFQHMDVGQEVEIEYQVLEGGDLDIDLHFLSPTGKSMVRDSRRTDGLHTISATEKGDHQLCVDNSFSTMTDKLVFLDLSFDQDSDDEWKEMKTLGDEGTSEEIERIQSSLNRVHTDLTKIIDIQSHLRAREARHRHTADSNNERVFTWSLLECGALVAVGGLQVFMLRRLFGSHSKTTA